MQIRSSALTGWLDRLARSWVSLAFAVGFVALWGALIRGFEVLRHIVPAPSAIFYQFWRNLPRIWEYTLAHLAARAAPGPRMTGGTRASQG